MELRRTLLRVLLAALALAALAGVVGVVTSAGDTIWQIVGTAGATAVAVSIMLPFSRMMDKEKSRTGGMGGMIWTVVSYVLVLGLIWGFKMFPSGSGEWLALTLLCWTICGLPAILLLRLTSIPEARIAGLTGVWAAAATFALLMVWDWREAILGWSTNNQKWLESGMALGGLGVVVVANLVHAVTNDRRWWRWVGITAACAGYLIAVAGIWQEANSPVGRQVLTFLVSLSSVLGLANLTLLVPLVGQQEVVRWGTILAGAVCGGAVNLLVCFVDSPDMEVWGRLTAGSAIVTGCGSLALLVLARINRRVEYRPEDGSLVITDIAVTCPRCSKSQKVKLGGGACKSCGLRIEITIEEPRCPKCGYLLYMLKSPVCPECGTAIAGESAATNTVQESPGA